MERRHAQRRADPEPPLPSFGGGPNDIGTAGSSFSPPKRPVGPSGSRRPPPINIPSSRPPIPPSQPPVRKEKRDLIASGPESGLGAAQGEGAGIRAAGGDGHEVAIQYQQLGDGSKARSSLGRLQSLASTRPSNQSFVSARSRGSSNDDDERQSGRGGPDGAERRQGAEKEDVFMGDGSESDSDLSEEFFDAMENASDVEHPPGGEHSAFILPSTPSFQLYESKVCLLVDDVTHRTDAIMHTSRDEFARWRPVRSWGMIMSRTIL